MTPLRGFSTFRLCSSHDCNSSLWCPKRIFFSSIPWYSLPSETSTPSTSHHHHDPLLLALSEAIRNSNTEPVRRLLPSLKADHIHNLLTTNPLSLPPTTILAFFNSLSTHAPTVRLTIHTYCAMAHFLTAHNIFHPAESLIRGVVSRKGRDSVSPIFTALLETQRQGDIHHHRPNFLYEALMTAYLQSGLISDSIQCFRLMKKHQIQFPFEPCVRLFHHLVKTRSTETALGFYKELLEGGFPPNVICFNILTNKFCKEGKIKEAQTVFDLITEWRLKPSVVSYNTLIGGYCKTLRDLDEGFRLKRLMEERRTTTPDVFTYSVLITALCKEGRLVDANSLFDEMCQRGLVANNVIYTALIDGYYKNRRIDSGMEIYAQMLRKGVLPDLVTCNTLIYGLCKDGNVVKAQKLLDEMTEKGVRPDKFSYTTLIDGCCKEGDIDTALELREKMDGQGIPLDEVTFSAVISSLCRAGRVSDAESSLREMLNADIKPDLATYTMVIDGFCKKGDVKTGFKLLREMRNMGHVPNVVTYNVLMNGLCKQGQMKNAGVLLDAMINVGVVPDDITFNILLDGHAKHGTGKSEDLKKWREEKGLVQDYASYTLLVNDIGRRR